MLKSTSSSLSSLSCSSPSFLMLPFLRNTPSTDRSICFIDEMMSSTTAGTRSVPGPTPSVDSAPSRSMITSSGTPKTPFFLTFLPLSFLNALPMFFQKVAGFLLSMNPSSSSRVNSDSTMGCMVSTARWRTMKYSSPESSEK